MDDNAARFAELGRMMNVMIARRTPAERDRLLQRHIASAMTPARKFRSLGMMINFVIRLRRQQARSEGND